MAHKQVNALATLSGIAADDLIPIFDSSEAGDEKLKKYTVQELKTDLTSMDPSAFGNWVKVGEEVGSLQNVETKNYLNDIGTATYVRMSVEIESISGTSHLMVHLGDSDSTDSSSTNYHGTVDGRRIVSSFNSSGKAVFDILYNTATKIFTILGTYHNGTSTSNINVSVTYKGSKTPTFIGIQSWNVSWFPFTGSVRFYKWQEVKPIELHSYELVKEYNLNNETLDDTIDWDGEADPDIKILSNMTLGRADVVFNGVTGTTNYDYGTFYSAAGTVQSALSENADKGNIGFADRQGISIGNLSQNEKVRVQHSFNGIPSVWGRNDMLWNSTDPVTSLRFMSNGSAATGNIKVYKLAKTHLFNQTIYNDTTLNVATTGSDITGTGSSQKPFASINGALDWLKNKTINSNVTVTIQVADGTYNNLPQIGFLHDSSHIQIVGNTTTPSNVTLNFTGNGILCYYNRYLRIRGLKLVGTNNQSNGLTANKGGYVYISDCDIQEFHVGISSLDTAIARIDGATIITNNNYGLYSSDQGAINISDGSVSNNNSYGLAAVKQGRILTYNTTITGNTVNTYSTTGGVYTAV